MKIFSILALAGVTLLGASALAGEPQTPPPAKLTMAQAREIALKAAPGAVIDAEYENENGAWRYSFDIRQGKRVHEIGVDANTGAIVEDSFEDARDSD